MGRVLTGDTFCDLTVSSIKWLRWNKQKENILKDSEVVSLVSLCLLCTLGAISWCESRNLPIYHSEKADTQWSHSVSLRARAYGMKGHLNNRDMRLHYQDVTRGSGWLSGFGLSSCGSEMEDSRQVSCFKLHRLCTYVRLFLCIMYLFCWLVGQ